MRIEAKVFSISWIPSEAISGHMRIPMDIGIGHYDDPPPDHVEDLQLLNEEGRFRFANLLSAAIEVDGDGRIAGWEHLGRSYISTTDVHLGSRKVFAFQPVAFPDLRPEPEVGDGWVRFEQTSGGRTGAPMPRRVSKPPFVRISPPTAWTTLSLTLHADGRVEHEVRGASPFPRHWIYDGDGRLVAKSGITDFSTWSREHFGDNTPWGDVDTPALITQVETELERQLSLTIMRSGTSPRIDRLGAGELLTEQGSDGDDLYLLLDGVLEVEVDGEVLAQLGPGAIVGERAILEGGARTSTLRAVTGCKVAVAAAGQIDRDALAQLATGHRRETPVT
ncbi:MAG: cyclic nucleotide-binding domain-containing protein [Actinobacteria bacterium]|nr:cyclic nucleotide-binding domain-containing protein [Actinomycetota bacterium]